MIVNESITSLKVAVSDWLTGTFVVESAGTVKITVGDVESSGGLVIVFPAKVTAPMRAKALPFNTEPVFREID